MRNAVGEPVICQVSPHPRGRRITFTDTFAAGETKTYTYSPLPALPTTLNTRKCYVGAERIRDIVNDYDPLTYHLPYEFENRWFLLKYRPGQGVTSFVDKRTGRELLPNDGIAPFFTPLYEHTPITIENPEFPACRKEQERRIMGRNIRGKYAKLYTAALEEVTCEEHGEVFTVLCLRYTLPGTIHCSVYLKLYEGLPRIDFRLELGKTISEDIGSVFLPLSLSFAGASLWARKGTEAYRPGTDQLPGTCMEYTMSDYGIVYTAPGGGAMIATPDVPLLYFGEMRHHPIRLCDGKPENNRRPVYSWLMNNTWETNFKMDLSGFGEFCYTLWLTEETDAGKAMDALQENSFAPVVYIIE